MKYYHVSYNIYIFMNILLLLPLMVVVVEGIMLELFVICVDDSGPGWELRPEYLQCERGIGAGKVLLWLMFVTSQ